MFATIAVFVLVGSLAINNGQAKAFYSQNLVVNGGFEANPLGTGWEGDTYVIDNVIPGDWHSGSRGALISYSSSGSNMLYQTINLPSDTTSAIFSVWYQFFSFETGPTTDLMAIDIRNPDDLSDIWFSNVFEPNVNETGPVWTHLTADITSHKGQTGVIILWFQENGLPYSWGLIDDVSVIVEKSDVTAPTTTLSSIPSVPNGSNSFYTTIPTITLSVSDDVGGSGVDKPFYTWDGGVLIPYAGPFAALEGTHTLSYISSDVAGNAEVVKKSVIKVDTGVPATTAGVSLAPNSASGWYSGAPTVTLASTDGTSGIGGIYYNWDGAAMTPYSAAIAVPSGAHTLNYYAIDGAGNSEPMKTLTLKLDSSGPTITLDKPDASVMTNSSVYTIAGKVSDAVSGLAGLSINGISTPVNPDGSFSQNVPVKLGANVVTLSATDTAGNNSVVTQTVTYKHPVVLGISTSRPTVTNKKPVKGSFDIKVGTSTVSVTPFGKGFSGKIWADSAVRFGRKKLTS